MEIMVNEVKFENKELAKATREIANASNGIKKNLFKIAEIMARVNALECFKDDGFNSIADYAKKTFGIERATAFNMVAIGRDYIDPETHESVLHHEATKDFTTSQIVKMLPLSVDRAKELTEDGTINASMSCREIEKIVKDLTTEPEEGEGEETEEGEGEAIETTAEEVSETKHTLELCEDAEGNRYIVYDGKKVEPDDFTAIVNVVRSYK